ncbi:RHS repeat domain-containing protein [Wukongibacter baidiensis]
MRLFNFLFIDYDKSGNIIGQRDKKGQITTFDYDYRNRLLSEKAGTVAISYTYGDAGKLETMEDTTGITNYTYYENGRLKRQTEPDGKYIEYDYDKSGNMTQTTDYFGKITTYGYDNRNRLKTVTVDGETTTYTYYADGARNNILYPGGVGTEYIYDGMNNLISLKNVEFSGVINEFSYTYDGVRNQLTKVDTNGTTTYTYDKLNRLETVSEPDGNQVTYTFDDNGNIKTKDLVHPANYTYTFKQGGAIQEMNGITSHTISYNNDASNKLTSVTETIDNTGAVSSPYVGTANITVDLDYDGNGNLITTTKGGSADTEISSYKYNQLNQMIEYTSPGSVITSYSYDGNGLRKTKTSGSITTGFYYSGGNVINETENGVFKARNIRGINIIAREDNQGTKAYYLYNGHGDTVNLVTNTGEILNTYDYDVYGKAKVEEGSTDNPYRYAGEYYDEESELYYLRARYYDPNIARFISEDSYKGDPSYPLSLNLYTYTYNNPIKYIDPSGHFPNDLTPSNNKVVIVILYLTRETAKRSVEISNFINRYGDKVVKYGSEVAESVKEVKDTVVNALNNDRGSADLSKFGKEVSNFNFKGINARHYMENVKQKSLVRDRNTVVESWVDVEADITAINAGKAQQTGNNFEINGRIYGVKNMNDTTLYPISGDGFHQLNRIEYKAMGIYNQFGNTEKANMILNNMKVDADTKEKILDIMGLE